MVVTQGNTRSAVVQAILTGIGWHHGPTVVYSSTSCFTGSLQTASAARKQSCVRARFPSAERMFLHQNITIFLTPVPPYVFLVHFSVFRCEVAVVESVLTWLGVWVRTRSPEDIIHFSEWTYITTCFLLLHTYCTHNEGHSKVMQRTLRLESSL